MTWNPLDWTAVPFLTLYITLASVIFVIGFSFKRSIGPAAQTAHQLTVLELAYLAGGTARAGDAILLCLTSGGGATIAPKGHKITVTSQAPLAALFDRPTSLQVRPDMTRKQFQTAAAPLVDRIREHLQALGYCPTDQQMASFHGTFLPFVGLLLMLGTIKALVGSGRGHPVGFLIALLVGTVIISIALAARPTRTRSGNDVLQAYKESNARASRAPLEHELLLALALSGAVVLSGTAYESVYAASQTMSGSGGDGGGGGCGGGGGGCGGCS